MKKLLFICSVFALASCGGIDYQTHIDTKNNFQIDYPEDWDTANVDRSMAFIVREDFTDSLDIFPEGLSISVVNNQGYALEEIVEQNIAITKQFLPEAIIHRTEFATENEIRGIELRLKFDVENLQLANAAYFFMHNNFLYTITQSCERSKEDAYQEIFKTMINSFKFL
jgi:hypothetical protein